MTKYLIENHSGEAVDIAPHDASEASFLPPGHNIVASLDAATFHRLDASDGVRVTKRDAEPAAPAPKTKAAKAAPKK